jgi:hypothetical protein
VTIDPDEYVAKLKLLAAGALIGRDTAGICRLVTWDGPPRRIRTALVDKYLKDGMVSEYMGPSGRAVLSITEQGRLALRQARGSCHAGRSCRP